MRLAMKIIGYAFVGLALIAALSLVITLILLYALIAFSPDAPIFLRAIASGTVVAAIGIPVGFALLEWSER